MCNCGKKRVEYSNGVHHHVKKSIPPDPFQSPADAGFEYTGKTALTVKGNVTGKIYRFAFAGDIQSVDYRDAAGMRAVQVLRKIR